MGKKLVEIKKLPPERAARSKIVAVMNNKGGVGKSTLSIALGLYLLRKGRNVLFVDMDSQRNLTQRLGLPDYANSVERGSKTKVDRIGKIFREVLSEGQKQDVAIAIEYKGLKKIQGSERKGIMGLIAGDRNSIADANWAKDTLENSDLPLERQNISRYFRNEIDKYRHFYDMIILDTAPALDGNILNVLAARAADEIICPVDGLEAALGLQNFIKWVEMKTVDNVRKPNITIAMVKYQKSTRIEEREELKSMNLMENNIYRALASVFGSYICEHGVQESQASRKVVPGFDKDRIGYYVLSEELSKKLALPRKSIFEYFDDEKREALKARLSEIERMTRPKKVSFKGIVYKDSTPGEPTEEVTSNESTEEVTPNA